MIDDRALRSFIRNPKPVQFSAPPSQGGINKNGAWVTVVDLEWDPDTEPPRPKYQGFMRCYLLELEVLALLGSVHHMSEMIHRARFNRYSLVRGCDLNCRFTIGNLWHPQLRTGAAR